MSNRSTGGPSDREGRRKSTDRRPSLVAGDWVVYRPYPDAQGEDGTVTAVHEDGTAHVLYRGDQTAKLTRIADLERGMADA